MEAYSTMGLTKVEQARALVFLSQRLRERWRNWRVEWALLVIDWIWGLNVNFESKITPKYLAEFTLFRE